jgi:excinuclease ABC subunit C
MADQKINDIIEQIPQRPGIYIMKGSKGEILYIGKAKSLRNRVRSYFQSSRNLHPRTRAFVAKVVDIKTLTTETETEALILESNFIKKHQPRYNVLLKDDKHYPYILLTTGEAFPRLIVVRRVKKDGHTYFGPYTMVKEVRETIRLIYKIFPLRQSRDVLDGSAIRRPCLNHQMGRCLAPCAGGVSMEDYARIVQDVVLFLRGKNTELIDSLKVKMVEASEAQRYETAASWRDKISAVQTVLNKQKIISTSLEDQDAIGYSREGRSAMAQVLVIREGKMVGEKIFKLKCLEETDNKEALSSFLKQYYANESIIPAEILLPQPVEDAELISRWLTEKCRKTVRLEIPVRGKKRDLVCMAEENAQFSLRTELDKGEVNTRILEDLRSMLDLKRLPKVIEGFDISNISGTHSVGSMVSFVNGLADKSRYRKFKIARVEGINDYAMLKEVIERRYSRLLREDKTFPDLILVDGGRGHLNSALESLERLNIADRVDLACIAKGKYRNRVETDEVLLPNRKDPVLFSENSPPRFLLQRVRDESHRFAISFHRQLRGKSGLSSPLEKISGVGKKRRLMLLKKFGSLEKIRSASLEDLKTIPGVTDKIAEQLQSI